MRTIRPVILVLLLLVLALAPVASASAGLLGLTPAELQSRLGRRIRLYWTFRSSPSSSPVYLYCLGGMYHYSEVEGNLRYYDPKLKPLPGIAYGPCARYDRARRETVLIRYQRGRVVAAGYAASLRTISDGWLQALDLAISGIDREKVRPIVVRQSSPRDDFGTLAVDDVYRYPGGVTYVGFLQAGPPSTATIWYSSVVRVSANRPLASPDPMVELLRVLVDRYHP